MKICLVSSEYPPETGGGGIGTQTYLKAQGLTRRGHQVHVICASHNEKGRTLLDGEAVIHRLGAYPLDAQGYESSTHWLANSRAVSQKLNELDRSMKFDLIQFPEYGAEGFLYQTDTFQYRTARYVVQLHGPLGMFVEHMGWPERGSTFQQVGCFMERMVIHHADHLLASSHNTAAFCSKYYDRPLDTIEVIHSGVDTIRFYPRPPSSEKCQPRILFIGNIAGNKGISLLVDAVLHLRKKYPHIHLRAIGKGDEKKMSQLKKQIVQEKAESHIEFLGLVSHEQLPEQHAWCDFFAGPSTYEPGPGNVYLEAMACGRPVIACNTGGTPEVVLDQKTGILIPPQSESALITAIERLTEDQAFREELGKNGRQWVEERFSIEKYLDRVELLYKRFVGQT